LNFTCTQCGNCCTGGPGFVWISDIEIDRLAEHLALSRDQLIERYCRRINGRSSLNEIRNARGEYDCVFLKEDEAPARAADASADTAAAAERPSPAAATRPAAAARTAAPAAAAAHDSSTVAIASASPVDAASATVSNATATPAAQNDRVIHTRRRCTIYHHRPLQCRTWPFWDGNLSSREIWDRSAQRCHGMNRGKGYTLAQIEAVRNAADWPQNPPTSKEP
jgi:Fe-S-cluster containining protein